MISRNHKVTHRGNVTAQQRSRTTVETKNPEATDSSSKPHLALGKILVEVAGNERSNFVFLVSVTLQRTDGLDQSKHCFNDQKGFKMNPRLLTSSAEQNKIVRNLKLLISSIWLVVAAIEETPSVQPFSSRPPAIPSPQPSRLRKRQTRSDHRNFGTAPTGSAQCLGGESRVILFGRAGQNRPKAAP